MSSTITSTHPRLSTTLPTGKFSKMPAENCESTNCSAVVGRLMLPLIAAVNLVFKKELHLPLDGESGEADPVLVVVLPGGHHDCGGEEVDNLVLVTSHIN